MPKGDNPNSRANLKPITKKTARELGRRGAMVSNAKQAKARTLAEELKALLLVQITNSKGEKVTTQTAISTAMIKAALSGDVRAFNTIRDTIGQKPVEQVESSQTVTIKDDWRKIAEDLGISNGG
jgi:hypothetical protein